MPFWISWILIWTIIFSIDLYLSLGNVQAHSHFTELGVAAFCASVGINVGLSTKIMINLYQDLILFIDSKDQNLETWYTSKLKWMYEGAWPILAVVTFSILVELTAGQVINSYNQASESILYFRTGYRMFGFFLLGLSLWSIINFMRLPAQLLLFKFKLRLSNLSGIGLQALGNAFLKIALMGIGSFIILIFTIMVSPVHENAAILVWVALGGILIFSLFLFPQLGIHRIMAVEKRQQLISFSNHLEEALARSMKEPTSENMQKLKEMFDLQQYLKSLNDWPFNANAMWQLISALLIPLMLVILQIMFKL